MLLNFSDYKAWQKTILKTHDPLRLDCLNPFIAMRWSQQTGTDVTGDPTSMLTTLLGHTPSNSHIYPVPGVRSALEDIFIHASHHGWSLALPQDVYPFYWDAATRAGHDTSAIVPFRTLPTPDLTALNTVSGPTLAVITAPVSPLGRHLTPAEIAHLTQWLTEDKTRILVLDTVYAYQTPLHPGLEPLWKTNQTIVLNSLSKTHLQRGLFGVAILPQQTLFNPTLRTPTFEGTQAARNALTHHPHHARDQQQAFTREWERLAPKIETMTGQSFTPPENGYMAPVPIAFDDALTTHNTLLVPASVFGSLNPNLSIATCLHDISSHQ